MVGWRVAKLDFVLSCIFIICLCLTIGILGRSDTKDLLVFCVQMFSLFNSIHFP